MNKQDIINTIESNSLLIDEELHIMEVLLKKYPLITISECAEKLGKTSNGIRYMIKNKQLPTCEVNGKVMIISVL